MASSRTLPKLGLPQYAALTLLFIFAAQCLWFMANVPITQMESSYIEDGLLHVDRLVNAGTEFRSPLIPLLAGVPANAIDAKGNFAHLSEYRFLIRLPFLLAGLLLGASLWYVARRLYGNLGGYIALGMYCFSPMVVTRSSQVQPDIIGAWGAFGLVFTGIAAAHTLYAPRGVVFWELETHRPYGRRHRSLRRLTMVIMDRPAANPRLHVMGSATFDRCRHWPFSVLPASSDSATFSGASPASAPSCSPKRCAMPTGLSSPRQRFPPSLFIRCWVFSFCKMG